MHIFKIVKPERAYPCERLVKLGLAFSNLGETSVSPAGEGAIAQVCGVGHSSCLASPASARGPVFCQAAPRQTVGIVIRPGGWAGGCSWGRPAM